MTHQNLPLGKCWKLFRATLKWDHFEILAKDRSDTLEDQGNSVHSRAQTYPKRHYQQQKALSVLVCIFLMQIFLSFCHCYC